MLDDCDLSACVTDLSLQPSNRGMRRNLPHLREFLHREDSGLTMQTRFLPVQAYNGDLIAALDVAEAHSSKGSLLISTHYR